MPNPINQAMRPKMMTPLSRENIFSSSIQAVKGSIKDTEELKAAIETNITVSYTHLTLPTIQPV